MKIIQTLSATILLMTFSLYSHAEVAGITPGKTLQVQAEKITTDINTEDLKKLLDSDPDVVLIDIRTPTEIRKMGGAIKAPQNVNIVRGWLEFRVTGAAQSKDTPIVVYCGGNIRSPLAAKTLQDMGYSNVKNYADGFLGWRKAGLPTAQAGSN